ncbi:hypothetical protein [Actinacidiphila bryophytorum]|uniref:hypothetical protein n=1 Tax=Actinacidiphila bryophytorum TaxID=1436133 RepID=UPI0021769A32|nr:hypothetical protein [Actinacidiphila bryophytorum]UWE13007.1 hypothetical protein NYE86_32895 [Actinacidiphila bryophytorum]
MTYPLTYRAPQEPVSGGWVAPLVSSLITLPLAFCAFVYASLSPMACDSCEDAAAAHFEDSFEPAFDVLAVALGLSLVLLLVSWALPRRERNVGTRWVLAVFAPCLVVIGFVIFYGLVDWPASV